MPAYVEIFHDQASGMLPTESVHQGLDMLGRIVGEIAVTREARQIKLGNPDTPTITVESVRWPQLPANFSIVLTERDIVSSSDIIGRGTTSDDYAERALSISGLAFIGSDVALVKVDKKSHKLTTPYTVAHELAHLYELSPKYGQGAHCSCEFCIMSPVYSLTEETVTLQQEATKRKLFSRRKITEPPKQITHQGLTRTYFCGDCSDGLAQQSQLLRQRMALKTMRNAGKL